MWYLKIKSSENCFLCFSITYVIECEGEIQMDMYSQASFFVEVWSAFQFSFCRPKPFFWWFVVKLHWCCTLKKSKTTTLKMKAYQCVLANFEENLWHNKSSCTTVQLKRTGNSRGNLRDILTQERKVLSLSTPKKKVFQRDRCLWKLQRKAEWTLKLPLKGRGKLSVKDENIESGVWCRWITLNNSFVKFDNISQFEFWRTFL